MRKEVFVPVGPRPRFDQGVIEEFAAEARSVGWPDLADAVQSLYRSRVTQDVQPDTSRQVIVQGSSDDLVEIDGAISEEFEAYDVEECTLTFSEGTVLGVRYDEDGIWRVRVIDQGSAQVVDAFTATDPDGDECSDRITLRGDFRYVIFTRGDKR